MAKFTLDFELPLAEMEAELEEMKRTRAAQKEDIAAEIAELEGEIEKLRRQIYSRLTPWQRVQLARHPMRPTALDYITRVTRNFTELHGDRVFRDDPAVVAGLAELDGYRIAVIAQQKGRNTKEKIARNFGMPHPEGYRKALRVARLAEKFALPLVCLIDTSGAYPGVGAEERGQAWAIAENLRAFAELRTPVIVVNIGEGGSGGALAIGVGDRVYMMENAYYSVISPEGCASIIYGDAARAPEAATALKLTATDLLESALVDGVISEPLGGAHRDPESAAWFVRRQIDLALAELAPLSVEDLLSARQERWRRFGAHLEDQQERAEAAAEALASSISALPLEEIPVREYEPEPSKPAAKKRTATPKRKPKSTA